MNIAVRVKTTATMTRCEPRPPSPSKDEDGAPPMFAVYMCSTSYEIIYIFEVYDVVVSEDSNEILREW